MADLKTIEDLTNAFGPSGFEEEVVKAVQKHCEGLNLRNDAMYNVYATMPDAKGNRPVFMLDAHVPHCHSPAHIWNLQLITVIVRK